MGYFQAAKADSVQASVTPWSEVSTRRRRELVTDSNWQSKVRRYDVEGPGIVGATLDIPAAMSMLLNLCVQRRGSKGWETVDDDPKMSALLGLWDGGDVDQATMFARLIRTLDGPGEGYMILHSRRGEGRLRWEIAQTLQITDQRNGTFAVKDSPDARPGDDGYRVMPDRFLFHFRQEDPAWPGVAWSPQRRGLPHLEDWRRAQRNIGRGLDSQLAMNGIMWAEAIVGDKSPGGGPAWVQNMLDWAHKSISSDDTVESVAPFPMQTASKPEFIEVGRGQFADQVQAADEFLKSYARAMDFPTQMLLEGPATGKYWNSFIEGDYTADFVMRPRWQRACQILTVTHLRPLMQVFGEYRPSEWRVWADDTAIRAKTDNTENVKWAREQGIANRFAAARAAGLSPDEVMPLPAGVSEWEAWAVSRSPGLLDQGGVAERGPLPVVGDGVPGFVDGDGVPGLPSGVAASRSVLSGWDELVPWAS